eukprot:TRINITY_DN75044_c0_g1_i1.p1 TRINITY_DN75044_c0_g1~~TRINITY_DN75044_c0_g1_i1.p1  ORF type:complete len:238 (+),score=64.16 TRINITY_DN75044_c0_g1_i1:106-819(+)
MAPTDEASVPSAGSSASSLTSHLILFNVGKRQNFGTLLRSACAFGVSEVCVVGAKKLATFGNQGTSSHAPFRYFDSLEGAKLDLKSRGVRVCGVEITPEATPIHECRFEGSTAFMLGNEGHGMTPAQRAVCDFFVYIPQYSGATASLNVAVAGSIVLHHFALRAALAEQPRSGEKFVVEAPRSSLDKYTNPTEAEKEEISRKRAERAAKKQRTELGGEASADAAAAEGADGEDDEED